MLRRKLLIILGLLVSIWVVAAIVAILLVHGALKDIDHIRENAVNVGSEITQFVTLINRVDAAVADHQADGRPDVEEPLRQLLAINDRLDSPASDLTDAAVRFRSIRKGLAEYRQEIAAMAVQVDDETGSPAQNLVVPSSIRLREEIAAVSRDWHDHSEAEQAALTTKIRRIAVGLGILFLVLINLCILAMLRIATLILAPVEQLIQASRRMALEDYDTPVEINTSEEFSELATAYNNLAIQLQVNEQRKVETLQQVATTLNHELNNAMSIIELELFRLEHSSTEHPETKDPLNHMREALHRMATTIYSLQRVRRIVLTDYSEGVKMLDLPRSLSDSELAESTPPERES